MLTGCQPFIAGSNVATISLILTKEPEPIQNYVPSCPVALERIVRKCLAKERDERYQTMRDIAKDLELLRSEVDAGRGTRSLPGDIATRKPGTAAVTRNRTWRIPVATGALLILILAAVLAYVWTSRKAATTGPPIRALAVLPLENLSGDPTQDYFADGMTEALINNLTQIKAFNPVISRPTMMHYKVVANRCPKSQRN
jgi:hypothetical protein